MIRTKCGSHADKILRRLGVGHEVTLEAADWIDAATLFVVQQKIEFDRAGQLDPSTMEGFAELLLRAKARQGAEEEAQWIAQILGPATALEEAEERIRALCTAGYITEQDVDDLLLH